jgi:Fic family protein
MHRITGRYVRQQGGLEPFSAFIPEPLPPHPSLSYDALQPLLTEAALELGRLDALSRLIPDAALFLYGYVRREAVLSSQIEGTQSSLNDLLRYENDAAPRVPEDDVVEVSNYIAAMTHGLDRLRDGFPLSLRLIREMHGVLMRGARGAHADAGEFRRTQNWIGGHRPGTARFVPPPAHEVPPAMSALEQFLHAPSETMSPIVTAGLAHVQFETIHPFLDGNGRLGRLLITCVLCAQGVLTQPLLYLSLFFKNNRATYDDLLGRVREDGDWERWLQFYLEGVRDVSRGACEKAQQILELFARDKQRVATLPRKSKVAGVVYTLLKEHGMVSATVAAQRLSMTFPTATAALGELETLGIVREITGRRRDRVYAYQAYLDVLNAEG